MPSVPSSSSKDSSPLGLGPSLTTSFYLHYLFKDSICKYTHVLRFRGLALQHIRWRRQDSGHAPILEKRKCSFERPPLQQLPRGTPHRVERGPAWVAAHGRAAKSTRTLHLGRCLATEQLLLSNTNRDSRHFESLPIERCCRTQGPRWYP